MEAFIEFSFAGKNYKVGEHAYGRFLIVLPDGSIIKHNGWLESIPPVPVGLCRVPVSPNIPLSTRELADWLGAALAVEMLNSLLEGVSYALAAPTLLTIFCADEDRLWQIDDLLRKNYGAYGSGPAMYGISGQMSRSTFGFRHQEDLDRARAAFGFPRALQAGPPLYI